MFIEMWMDSLSSLLLFVVSVSVDCKIVVGGDDVDADADGEVTNDDDVDSTDAADGVMVVLDDEETNDELAVAAIVVSSNDSIDDRGLDFTGSAPADGCSSNF